MPFVSDGNSDSGGSSGSCHKNGSSKNTGKKKPRQRVVVYIDDDSDESSSSDNDDASSASVSSKDLSDYYSSAESEEDYRKPKRRKTTTKEDSKITQKSNQKQLEEGMDEEYYVEKIEDMRTSKDGRRFFFVKWLNYSSDENTWEPEENLNGCKEVVEEYMESLNKKRKVESQKVKAIKKKNSAGKFIKQKKNGIVRNENKRRVRKHVVTITEEKNEKTRNAMKESVQRIINHTPSSSPSKEAKIEDDVILSIPANYAKTLHPASLFYFKVVSGEQIDWIFIDVLEPLKPADSDLYYKCVVTEDLTDKQPKFIYGATTSVDGDTFCLVQFENHSYVEVIPPANFFAKFPSFRKFFEIRFPDLFVGKC